MRSPQYFHRCGLVLFGLVALAPLLRGDGALAGVALTLSDASSDETDAEMLDATLTFTVLDGTLTLTVRNDTAGADAFDISAVYFNVGADIADLSLVLGEPGWSLLPRQRADGFGRFDFALLSVRGNDPDEIAPGESSSFILDIEGAGSFHDLDFTTDFRALPPGSTPSIAAAKFVNGPGDDSAFGVVVSEPGTALLISICLGLLGRRSRHRVRA